MSESATHTNGKPAPIRYASVSKAAIYCDVNPATIRRMIADGRIKGYRSGTRLIRVNLTELDALLASG